MNSILGGVVLMLLISVIAGVGLNSQFNEQSQDAYLSPTGSVRIGN